MEISVKWIAMGILCFKISLAACYYPEYILEDECKFGNETVIYKTPSYGGGILKAASHPPYKPNKNCTIVIKPPADRGIVLSIRKMDLREGRLSYCYDYLKVFHSDIFNSPTIICRFHFDLEEKVSFYTKGPMTIVYHTGPGGYPEFSYEEGFSLTYTVASEDLQDCVKDNVFMCDNGRCISKEMTCDGRNNCGDRSDESHVVCDSGMYNYQPMDATYAIVFSVLILSIVISCAIVVTRRRRGRIIDTDSVSDPDEPTTGQTTFQAIHPTRFLICQNPAGPYSAYPQRSKVGQLDGGFSNPCYPHGIPQPPSYTQ